MISTTSPEQEEIAIEAVMSRELVCVFPSFLPFSFLFLKGIPRLCEQRGHLERSCEEEREGIKIKVAEPIVVYRLGTLLLSAQSFFCLPHKIFLIFFNLFNFKIL